MKEVKLLDENLKKEFVIKIGKNAQENWNLLDIANENDYFFHLSSFPSCYVILENKENFILSDDIIEKTANLCKENTKYRHLKNIKVDVTQIKNVKKGENVGEVFYLRNKNVKKINT